MSKSTPSVQRGTKVATGQFLYSFICHQKKGIKMLQQHVSSNIRASGKELFPLPLFYHDPLVDFQCLLKTESLPSMSHLHYPHSLVYRRMSIIGLTTRIETSSILVQSLFPTKKCSQKTFQKFAQVKWSVPKLKSGLRTFLLELSTNLWISGKRHYIHCND